MNSIKKIFALFLSCQMIVSFGNIINIEATESFEDFDSINGVPPHGPSTSTYNKGRRIDTNILQFVYNNPNI